MGDAERAQRLELENDHFAMVNALKSKWQELPSAHWYGDSYASKDTPSNVAARERARAFLKEVDDAIAKVEAAYEVADLPLIKVSEGGLNNYSRLQSLRAQCESFLQ